LSYVVIKCGGSILEQLPETFYKSILQLVKDYQLKPIIVHGGGPEISNLLEQMEIETTFMNGLRVTTEPVLDVVEMVLSGSVNKKISRKLTACGGKAVGISGIDGSLLLGKQKDSDLGFVGDILSVKHDIVKELLNENYIPVISPLALDENGQRLNINADTAASAIAKALNAQLWMITNVPGVMKQDKVISQLTLDEVEQLIDEKIITGGMIPKVHAACECIESGVKEVVIINGLEENGLLKLASGKQIGSKIIGKEVLING